MPDSKNYFSEMVFGISYTGILVLTASGLYLIGEQLTFITQSLPLFASLHRFIFVLLVGAKDLPRVARQLGVVTGRAVAYVSAIRRQALSFADETEISKVLF